MSIRHHRVSSVDQETAAVTSINLQLQAVTRLITEALVLTDGSTPSIHTIQKSSDDLRVIHRLLVEAPAAARIQDEFRRCQGLEACLTVWRSANAQFQPSNKSQDDLERLIAIVKDVLDVLSEALAGSRGSQEYFETRVEGDGWDVASELLSQTWARVSASPSTLPDSRQSKTRLVGLVLDFVICDSLFADILPSIALDAVATDSLDDRYGQNTQLDVSHSEVVDRPDPLLNAVKREVKGNERIKFPRMAISLFNITAESIGLDGDPEDYFLRTVLHTLSELVRRSELNLVSLHRTDFLHALLTCLEGSSPPTSTRATLERLLLDLLRLGFPNVDNARQMFSLALSSQDHYELLYAALQASKTPSHFHFDLSMHGYSSIELASIAGPFPHAEGASGYTFMCWLQIDKFDENCHTTIFGAFDESQSAFVLLYLESKSHQLVLQTSIRSSKPSTRFRSTVFRESVWYHIAVVHEKGRGDATPANLFVNGELVETVAAKYPDPPPLTRASLVKASSSLQGTAAYRQAPVQAFVGTPRDLSPQLGEGSVTSKWSLASAYLLNDLVPKELVLVYNKLGPSYHGSFQDCLGPFQTYQASATLNLINESLHPGREESSVIFRAIHGKAGDLMPEKRITLALSATSMLPSSYLAAFGPGRRSIVAHSKELESSAKLRDVVVVNSAFPSLKQAATSLGGTALLAGGTVVCPTVPFQESAWSTCGSIPLCLRLIETATSKKGVSTALSIFLDVVRKSWRTSEIMETEDGFGALSLLLREKLDHFSKMAAQQDQTPFSEIILAKILKFVGYNDKKPAASVIINPLAYRILLVDSGIWQMTESQTQKTYYRQFIQFAASSHSSFNCRRLNRMRIVKKFLGFMQNPGLHPAVAEDALEAFRILLESTMSSEVLRAVAMYITFAVHRPDANISLKVADESRTRASSFRSYHSGTEVHGVHRLGSVESGVLILEMLERMMCEDKSNASIYKLGRSVTNKWLLHLLHERNTRVVSSAMKILAHLLVSHGRLYIQKFEEKTNGFVILAATLRQSRRSPDILLACFAIMFGLDTGSTQAALTAFPESLLETIVEQGKPHIFCPQMLLVITEILKESIVNEAHPSSPNISSSIDQRQHDPEAPEKADADSVNAALITRTIRYLHSHLQSFRDFVVESNWTRLLLAAFYASESRPKPTDQNFLTERYELEQGGGMQRPKTSQDPDRSDNTRTMPPILLDPPQLFRRRASSFVLVRSSSNGPRTVSELSQPLRPASVHLGNFHPTSPGSDLLVDCIIDVFKDQVFCRRDFPGLGLFLKSPASTIQDQAMVTSYLIERILLYLRGLITDDPTAFHDSRSLTNMARFLNQTCEALYEGWFLDTKHTLLSFAGELLVYLQTSPACDVKGVKWSTVAINSMKQVFVKCLIQSLSFATRSSAEDRWTSGVDHVRSSVAFGLLTDGSEDPLNLCLLSLTYQLTSSEEQSLAKDSVGLLRVLLQSRPDDFLGVLDDTIRNSDSRLAELILQSAHASDESLWSAVRENRRELDAIFEAGPNAALEQFIVDENLTRRKSANARLMKRRERLEQVHLKELQDHHALIEHEVANRNWTENIQASERLRYIKAKQDQQEGLAYHSSTLSRLCGRLETLNLVSSQGASKQWQLDDVEGHNRMRFRLSSIKGSSESKYQPKTAARKTSASNLLSASATPPIASLPITPPGELSATDTAPAGGLNDNPMGTLPSANEDDFEMVSKPLEDEDSTDDKNRKVMRSLQRGEQVIDVVNATRILGLGACQTLLIIGKGSMYLVDHLFQRSDGEVVRADQAPKEERDSYMESLLDKKTVDPSDLVRGMSEVDAKHWPWHEIISISKRHFLFRDVALEIFFGDGRSCLLTLANVTARDAVYTSLLDRATTIRNQVSGKREESAWRIEMLRNPRDAAQSFGAKFANVFGHSAISFTRQWSKGEMSNFHYLMIINTIAGRSFNDLTQYPVFPWVLADYTSAELDLTNPASFRDFTKPMGCQTPERETAFRDRYRSFAEMLDSQTPAFHYGTHYSSAMIVSSYLMRLQPFVQSYLLLQGGRFDHPERLFSSIKNAWLSSSRETMTDVRELTPEFFYLPDFLTNINGFEFGTKRDGSSIDDVELPPWAKGDPTIFIAKHREALESPFVSKNLHQWINLIFGSKQRGEAAVEATNVFHHLSYHGAKDLDSIEDEHEKLATIGIIHNFGQTPRQVFTRAHDRREEPRARFDDVARSVTSLRRMPGIVCTIPVPVCGLRVSPKNQKVLASGNTQAYLPPYYNALLEWGHSDFSVRFYATQSKPNIFEQLHQDQISSALFADSKTLVTASVDCTIAVWNLENEQKNLQLLPKGFLFGHSQAVTSLAASSALSTLVSASKDGKVMAWDLNRLEKLRTLHEGAVVEQMQINNYNGQILLCSRQTAYLYTLNGHLLLTQNLCSAADDRIFCCAFLEPSSEEWTGAQLIFTGHRRGGVNIWSLVVNKQGKWELELLHRLQNTDQTRGDGVDYTSAVTCILPSSHLVYVGDEDGRVSQWEFTW